MTARRRAKFSHELMEHYGDPLALLCAEPQSVTNVYYRWAEVPPKKSLTRRERNERSWLARHLVKAAERREIERVVATADSGREYLAFIALDADEAGRHQPRSTAPGPEHRRRDGRGVGQRHL